MPIGSMVYAETLYAYDNQGRLYQVKDNGAVIATYAYDANGNRHSLTYVNGVTATYGYNLSNLVTSLENKKGTTALSKYTYTYLLDGNQRTKTDHTGLVTTYCYDGLGRLTNEQESTGQSLAYGYDSFGNRASLTASGPESYTTTYQYDLNNRLTTETKEQGGDTLIKDYQYDANGNTVSILPSLLTDANGGTSSLSLNTDLDGATLNQYDGVNRLVQVETGETTATYTYRPDGLRSTKTVNGVTTTYVWDGSSLVMELTDGAVTGKYLRGVGLIAADLGGTRSYYLYNTHGDVTGLTDGNGSLTKAYDYDAFGNEKTAPDENDTNPFRYCGEYWDTETGSYYLRARYYQPGLGRFSTEDTYWSPNNMIYGDDSLGLNTYIHLPDLMSIRQSGNLYVYGLSNPVRYSDPTGNLIPALAGIGSAGAGAVGTTGAAGTIGGAANAVGRIGGAILIIELINDTNKRVDQIIEEAKPKKKAEGKPREKKEKSGEKDLGDADIKDLDKVPKDVIDEHGGEEFTQGLKEKNGRSKSDLYWDKSGNLYTVPKRGGPPQFVGQIPRK